MSLRRDQQNSIQSKRSLLKSGGTSQNQNQANDKHSPMVSGKKQTP